MNTSQKPNATVVDFKAQASLRELRQLVEIATREPTLERYDRVLLLVANLDQARRILLGVLSLPPEGGARSLELRKRAQRQADDLDHAKDEILELLTALTKIVAAKNGAASTKQGKKIIKDLRTGEPVEYEKTSQQPGSAVPDPHIPSPAKNETVGRVSYLPPSRDGKKAVVAYVEPQLAQGLKQVAGMHGQSVQEYLTELIEKDLAAKQSPKYLEQLVHRMAKRFGPSQA